MTFFGDDCPVCLAEPAPGARCVLACDHAFCVECVAIIVAHSGLRGFSNAARCPVCRRAIAAFPALGGLGDVSAAEAWTRLRAAWDSKAAPTIMLNQSRMMNQRMMHLLLMRAEAAEAAAEAAEAAVVRHLFPRVSWWRLALAHAFTHVAFDVANKWERMGRMGRMSPVAIVAPFAPVALRLATVLPLVRATIPARPWWRARVRMRRRLALALTASIAVKAAIRRPVLPLLMRAAGPFLLFRGISTWVLGAARDN